MSQLLVVDPQPALARELSALMARFGDRVVWAQSGPAALAIISGGGADAVLIDDAVDGGRPLAILEPLLHQEYVPVALLSSPQPFDRLLEWTRAGVATCLIKPPHPRELVLTLQALLRRRTRIVCIGGGTGLYTLLLGLKALPSVHLTAVVNMTDDGGSSGRIRQAFGILPPGDVRRCLVALSTAPELMNELLQYRFKEGEGLRDHNLGNLLLTAMANLTGSMAAAVRNVGDILHTQGLVMPVTETLSTLVAQFEDGSVVRGEHRIDVPDGRDPKLRIRELWHEPPAVARPEAVAAILGADVVTIGPGDLFTSISATLTPYGMSEAVRASKARKLYVCNLMTKPGETTGYTVADHVREIVRFLGDDVLDTVLVSDTPVSEEAIRNYAAKDQEPVRLDSPGVLKCATRAAVRTRPIGREEELVRHDSAKLAYEIGRILGIPAEPSPDGAAARS